MGRGQVSIDGNRTGLKNAANVLDAMGQRASGLSRERFDAITSRAQANTGFSPTRRRK